MQVQFRTCTVDFYGEKGGQLQFSASPPKYRAPENNISWPDKMGAVFVEGAPPDPERPGKLDWTKGKVVFALADKDIGQIIAAIRNREAVKVIHTTGEGANEMVKTFEVGAPTEFKGRNTYNIGLRQKQNGEEKRISLFINEGDIVRLQLTLQAALPYILGFQNL